MVDSRRDVALVGRAPELTALKDAVATASDGSPVAVVVAGEAGVGKTRLVRELVDRLPSDALVLRAQCVDVGDPGLPYLAVTDLIRTFQAPGPEEAAMLDAHPLAAAMTRPGGPEERPANESDRLQFFDAMTTLLREAGRLGGPVVVVIEDLQWVDGSSGEFLRFMISRMHSERLLVVATVRTEGLAAKPRVRGLLSELSRLRWVQRLDLAPFDETEVADYLALLDTTSDPDVAASVRRRTGGNPYYVQTLAASGPVTADAETLPRALADLLVGRLDGLPDDARTVTRTAAVVAHPIADRLLRQVVELPDDATDLAIRVAVAEGLLEPRGAEYAFVHDLLRTAVYDDLLPGERARLHHAHATALASGPVGTTAPAEIAHHYSEAGDDPKTLAWSVRAANEAMRGLAPGEALAHLECVLDLWPTAADAAELAELTRCRATISAAVAAGLSGEPRRAIELASQAVELCDADGDASGGVEARAELVRRLVEVDAPDQAVRPAEEAVRLAESGYVGAGTTALAHVMLARALLAARRIDKARDRIDRAVEEAKAAGVPGLEVEALTTAAFLDEIAGDRPAAAARLGSALRIARSEGETAAELRAHYMLASLHYYNGDVAGSLPVLRTAMARVSDSGLRWSSPGVELRLLQSIALYVGGDFEGSLQAADVPESPPPDVAAARLAAVACYAAVAGGHEDAERRIEALRGSWDADPQVALVAGGCESELLAWAGDFAGAVAIAERAQTHLDHAVGEGMYGGLWLSAIGLAALADDADRCRRRRDDAGVSTAVQQGDALRQRVEQIVAGGRGRPGELGPEGHAWHLRALAELARLQGGPAAEEWRQALDAFGYGHVYEQARCHWRLAEALVEAGDRHAARPHAQAAAASTDQMGAVPLQKAIAATLTRARLGPSARGPDAVFTAREREVLALVAEGLTNKEIGKRLFISDKTASVHLSNVMTKLNVTSRTEAVTVAHRRGLLDVIGPDRRA